jgi:hypothetical protein
VLIITGGHELLLRRLEIRIERYWRLERLTGKARVCVPGGLHGRHR